MLPDPMRKSDVYFIYYTSPGPEAQGPGLSNDKAPGQRPGALSEQDTKKGEENAAPQEKENKVRRQWEQRQGKGTGAAMRRFEGMFMTDGHLFFVSIYACIVFPSKKIVKTPVELLFA